MKVTAIGIKICRVMTPDHEVARKKRKQAAFVPFPLTESRGVFGNNSHVLAPAGKVLFARKYI